MIHLRAATLAALSALMLHLAAAAAQVPAFEDLPPGRLLVSGSNTMAPLVSAIAERFRSMHPGVRIEVRGAGSERGITDARQGKADIGMVSRALGETEQDLRGLPIARDGVAVVVHKDNPVRSLSDAQLAGIYTGRLTRWKEVGGRDAPIFAVASKPSRSSSELFARYFNLAREDIKSQRIVGDNAERLKVLAERPDAILYMSVGQAERDVQSGAPMRTLPLDGVAATSHNVRAGNYPISRPLSLVTRGRPTGWAKAFIEFCASSQVTDIILAHDFVPYLD